MRQTRIDEIEQGLAAVLGRTEPWTDEVLVALELRRWADQYHEGRFSRGDLDVIAHEVHRWREDAPPPDEEFAPRTDVQYVTSLVLSRLSDVAQGREPGDLGDELARTVFTYPPHSPEPHPLGIEEPLPLVDPPHEPAVPARTRRHYEKTYPDPLGQYLRRLEYQNDLAALTKGNRLVEGGRTEAAARRWLQRNPGKHAIDAPPPRKRRSKGPSHPNE